MQGFYKFYIHLVHVVGFLCSLSHKKILQPTVTKKKERRKLIYNPLTTAAASSHTNKGRRGEGKLIYNPPLLPLNSSSCCHLNSHKQGEESGSLSFPRRPTASFLTNAQAEKRGSSFTIPPFSPRRQRRITTIDFPRPSPVGTAGASLRRPLLPLTLPVSPASSSSPLLSPTPI